MPRRQLTWNRYRGKDLRGACATAILHRITHLQPGECQQHLPGISELPSVGAIWHICRIRGDYCDRRLQLHNASRNIVRIYSHRRVAIQFKQETLANGSGGADTTTRLLIDCPTLPTRSGCSSGSPGNRRLSGRRHDAARCRGELGRTGGRFVRVSVPLCMR